MMLLTKELEKRFLEVGSQEEKEDKIAIVHFFNPTGRGNWFAIEYDKEQRMFFGYISLYGDYNDEWGYFSLDELSEFRGQFGLGIERDLYWKEKSIDEIIKEYTHK